MPTGVVRTLVDDFYEIYRGDTKGVWPLRWRWYSLCSKLHAGDEHTSRQCMACRTGRYSNDLVHWCDGLIYRHLYPVWFRWHNRQGSPDLKFLERHFPRLRTKRK